MAQASVKLYVVTRHIHTHLFCWKKDVLAV